MPRLAHINLLGLLLLGSVCLWQWRREAGLRHQLSAQSQLACRQEARHRDLESEKSRLAADLELFRQQAKTQGEALELERTKRLETESKLHLASGENAQLKRSLAEWTGALQARETRLAEISMQRDKIAAQLHQAATTCTELHRQAETALHLLQQRTEDCNRLTQELNHRQRESLELTELLNRRTAEYQQLLNQR
ncbi:MAG: hypothetical protein RL095_645 [Verrucomicrobiota bacterium]|jgi:hypothetical protein